MSYEAPGTFDLKEHNEVKIVEDSNLSSSISMTSYVMDENPMQMSKIFVGGLDFKLTSEELKQHFMKFGEVHDAIILKDFYTGSSRGFGFVTFTQEIVA